MPGATSLATLPRIVPGGKPAAVRFILPPNLVAAARRDAIAVRIEVEIKGRGRVPASMVPDDTPLDVPAAQLGAVYLVESWNGGKPAAFVQLTSEQLSALVAVARGEPVFFFANKPADALSWEGDELPEISRVLGPKGTVGDADQTNGLVGSQPPSLAAKPQRAPHRDDRRIDPDATPATVDGSEHFLSIQLPSRDHSSYRDILEIVKRDGFRLETSNRRWWLRDRHRTLQFLSKYWDVMEKTWNVRFTDNFLRNTRKIARAEVECLVEEQSDQFEVALSVRAGDASDREINEALSTGRAFVESGDRLFLFDASRLARLHNSQKALAGSTSIPLLGRSALRIPKTRVAETDGLLEDLSPNFRAPEEWKRRAALVRDRGKLAPAPMPRELAEVLRPYQLLGAAWLWFLHSSELGGILADEMGLGKTLQAIALMTAIRRRRPQGPPCLVVCPASLMINWRREANRFAPHLRTLVHHGGDRSSETGAFSGADVIITSYGIVARDRELFEAVRWAIVCADEAQHVKNRRSQNAQALLSLSAGSRILLTGTPVENSLDDLQALFAIILPGYMKGIPADARGTERQWHEDRIRRQAAPYIMRRTKRDVVPELPDKIEQTVFVELTADQRSLYERTRSASERELQKLQLAGEPEGRVRVAMFTELLRLRQICCDPRLVDDQRSPGESAKLAAFLELLDEAVDDGHRLLVFSQFTSLLGLVRTELEARDLDYCYLDGSMSASARQAEVDRFNATGANIPLFLLSLKAGGTGLNLAAADTVVHLDPWWNPAVEAQATDRAHRIGQTRVVTNYKLIAAETVEERVLSMQVEKRRLLADVFDASQAANAGLTLTDLQSLLSP